jgi:1-acyl-sn-glycerol-3-phosphate acyltransferase
VGRCIATLGYFFGASPIVAVRIRASPHTRSTARAMTLAHLRRTRQIGDIGLTVTGEELVPRHGGLVLVFNETSLVDLFATVEVLSRHVDRYVIAPEFARIPFIRPVVEQAGFVFMPRGDREATDRVLAALTNFAAEGGRVSFAAQGRVSPTPGVSHFKRGAFLVAIRARVPVLPMAVRGGREILPPRSCMLRPGSIQCRFGQPIGTTGLTDEDAPALAEVARGVVEGLYERIGPATSRAADAASRHRASARPR